MVIFYTQKKNTFEKQIKQNISLIYTNQNNRKTFTEKKVQNFKTFKHFTFKTYYSLYNFKPFKRFYFCKAFKSFGRLFIFCHNGRDNVFFSFCCLFLIEWRGLFIGLMMNVYVEWRVFLNLLLKMVWIYRFHEGLYFGS